MNPLPLIPLMTLICAGFLHWPCLEIRVIHMFPVRFPFAILAIFGNSGDFGNLTTSLHLHIDQSFFLIAAFAVKPDLGRILPVTGGDPVKNVSYRRIFHLHNHGW
jgi:hypothetical protein